MKRFRRRSIKLNLAGMFGNILLAASLSVLPVSAQQIITDGNTATNLNVNGSTTTVTTTTTKGSNAFNSFSRFNVDAGNKVELVVPDASDNLINLIHDEASVINGTLNSIKAGQVGGNIFLVNPHGITVGAQGVINVGSLTAITPTTDFMNTFFTAPGDPADASVTALINGTFPINAAATIDNQGKINAIENVKIDTGYFNNSGEIYTSAIYENDIEIDDIVNVNVLDVDNSYNPTKLEIVNVNGEIKIEAEKDISLGGYIYARNDINIRGETVNVNSTTLINSKSRRVNISADYFTNNSNLYTDGSYLNISALNQINLNPNSVISTRNLPNPLENNHITSSNEPLCSTGELYLNANEINLLNSSKIYTITTSGRSIYPEIVGNDILIDNATIIAQKTCPDSYGVASLSLIGAKIIASNSLTIYDDDILNNGLTFYPYLIETKSLISNFISNNSSLILESNSNLFIGNTDNVFIDGTPLTINDLQLDSSKMVGIGDNISTNGDISISSGIYNNVWITNHYNGAISAKGNININAGYEFESRPNIKLFSEKDINITAEKIYINCDLEAENITINPLNHLNMSGIEIIANDKLNVFSGNIEQYGMRFEPDKVECNELNLDFYQPGDALDLYSQGWLTVGNFENIFENNNKILSPSNISLIGNYVDLIANTYTSGDIYLEATNGNLSLYSYNNSYIKADGNISIYSSGSYGNIVNYIDLIAEGNINIINYDGIVANYYAGSKMSASNIYIQAKDIYNNTEIIASGTQKSQNLLVNFDESIDSSNSIIPRISGSNLYLNGIGSGGTINITGNLTGRGTFKAYGGSGNIDIINNSDLNLVINNLDASGEGHIIINGLDVTSDIITSGGTIGVTIDNSQAVAADITIQNNSASYTKFTGTLTANNLNINSQGAISLYNDTINADVVLNTTSIGVDGPAEIMLGNFTNDLTINGNLSATAINGNIYYYGGTVNGNAVFNSGESYDHRISVALGRFRLLNITGDLDVDSAGHVAYFGGSVGGDATIDADKMVGFMNVNIGGDLDVDAQAFGFFGGSVGGDMTIDADYGILIGVGSLLTVDGNADLESLYGPVVYYLGDVGGSLAIDADGIVNVGNINSNMDLRMVYGGRTYSINSIPGLSLPEDTNNFEIGSYLSVNSSNYVDFEGVTNGDISINGDGIKLITNLSVNNKTLSLNSDNEIVMNFTEEAYLNGLISAKGVIYINSLNYNDIIINAQINSGNFENYDTYKKLIVNADTSVDPVSNIYPVIYKNTIMVDHLSVFGSGGYVSIVGGEIKGSGNINVLAPSPSCIEIVNNSDYNLSFNLDSYLNHDFNHGGQKIDFSSGQIWINGKYTTEDINTQLGIINVDRDNSNVVLGNITINSTSSLSVLDGELTSDNLFVTSNGPIYLYNNIINSNIVLNTTAIGEDGPAEIMLGDHWGDLNIVGNINATATNGNIYYYGGTVNGNAVFNSGEAFDHRISVALGRYRPLNITGDLDVTSAGNVVYFGGSVGGDAIIDADKMVGFMNVNIGGDLDVDALAFGFFGGSVGGDMNIDAPYGILIGVGNLLTVNGNADLDSLYGPVGYYLGDVGGSLTIDAGGVVNVGNIDLLAQQTIDYNGQTYDVTDLPYSIPPDNNNFTVGNNLTINTPADVEFEGEVTGLVNVVGDDITHIENGNVNIGTMNSVAGDIDIEANTGAVDINYISTTGDIDINARDGIHIDTIDPANISLAVAREGGFVNINRAQVSESVNIKADNVQGKFENLNNSKALEFNVVGNDGNLASNVNISAASNTGLVFNSLKSVNADLKNLTSNTNLELNNAVVTNKITISSDYIDAKDNVIFNDVSVSGTSGSPKVINVNGLEISNTQNISIKKVDSILNLPSKTDIRDYITLDNDINQVNQTAMDKLGEDLTYNVENNGGLFSVNKASGSIVPDSAEFYLDENFENLTKELLDQANEIYNKSLENGETEEQAREKTKQYLLDSNLNSEIAKKLLEKQDFNNNVKFRKVLKLISLNN